MKLHSQQNVKIMFQVQSLKCLYLYLCLVVCMYPQCMVQACFICSTVFKFLACLTYAITVLFHSCQISHFFPPFYLSWLYSQIPDESDRVLLDHPIPSVKHCDFRLGCSSSMLKLSSFYSLPSPLSSHARTQQATEIQC